MHIYIMCLCVCTIILYIMFASNLHRDILKVQIFFDVVVMVIDPQQIISLWRENDTTVKQLMHAPVL